MTSGDAQAGFSLIRRKIGGSVFLDAGIAPNVRIDVVIVRVVVGRVEPLMMHSSELDNNR